MGNLSRRRIGKKKGKPCPSVVPLTQDWSDSVWTLLNAATVAGELGESDIRMMCLCEARRILRRGEPDPA